MMPQLSFIIPAYNCSSTIERCFDSIYACGLDKNDFEVVIVDDASTDDTYKIISQYTATHSNMIVERFSTNKKPGACVNRGIDCASGQYIQFMGADDTIDSSSSIIGALEQAVRWNVDIQANAFIFEKEKDHFVSVGCDYTPGVCMSGTVFCENFFDANLQFCSGPMYFWKRDFVLSDHRRAVEDRYYEDTDWIEHMLPKAKRLAFFNKPVYKYLYNQSSITHRKRNNVLVTDFLLMQIRRLENTQCCDLERYNAKIENYCKRELQGFLRVRSVTKYPFKQLKHLKKSLTADNYRNMRKLDFGRQANWFFRSSRLWLAAMFFMCRPAKIGRGIAALLRGSVMQTAGQG